MYETIDLIVLPRQTLNQEDFLAKPQCSIALDGVVRGGPFRDEETRHVNFDHHDGVDREITMSTCKQVFMAIKGGLFKSYRQNGKPFAYVYVNDSDQDTSLSVFELENNKMLEGSQSNPLFNRLLELTDKLDITGGAFPLNLSDKLMRQHSWIFQPYSELRKSGALATANHQVIQDNIESIMLRIKEYLMNRGGEAELDIRHKILYDSPYGYRIIHEIGGNDARYYLFGNGMDAFVSLVAERPDGKKYGALEGEAVISHFQCKNYMMNIIKQKVLLGKMVGMVLH